MHLLFHIPRKHLDMEWPGPDYHRVLIFQIGLPWYSLGCIKFWRRHHENYFLPSAWRCVPENTALGKTRQVSWSTLHLVALFLPYQYHHHCPCHHQPLVPFLPVHWRHFLTTIAFIVFISAVVDDASLIIVTVYTCLIGIIFLNMIECVVVDISILTKLALFLIIGFNTKYHTP